MKLKVFTLRLNETSGVFDDSELQAFLSERDAIAVDQHFFVHDGVPRWALLVHHREAAVRERGGGPRPRLHPMDCQPGRARFSLAARPRCAQRGLGDSWSRPLHRRGPVSAAHLASPCARRTKAEVVVAVGRRRV